MGHKTYQKIKHRDIKKYAVCSPGGFRCSFPVKNKKDLKKAKNFAIDHESSMYLNTYKRSRKNAKEFKIYDSRKVYDPYDCFN